jgi:glycosyltransferase involved in cell wall biosynthesis
MRCRARRLSLFTSSHYPMNILMISSTFPYPPNRGGTEVRTFNLLKYLHRHHHLTLVTQRHPQVSDEDIAALQEWVSELKVFPLATPPTANEIWGIFGKVGRFVESVAKATPPNVLYRYSSALQAWVDEYVRENKWDVITCEHSVNEIYIRPTWQNHVKTVVNIHSSVAGWTKNHLEIGASPHPLRDRLYLTLLLERYETHYCRKFSHIVVTTEDDQRQIQQLCPDATISIVSNGVDLTLFPYRPQDPSNYRLVFVGAMDVSHNIDAARFFTQEILPALQQQYPQTTFTIVGARPVSEVLELTKYQGVTVTGQVASVVESLHTATVCVIPLRTGYGIKNKTLEAMAAGVPVVGSDRALEGIDAGANIQLPCLRANSVAEYIAQIRQLFENPSLRQQLSHQARQLIETQYTWETAGKSYEQVLIKDALFPYSM